MERSLINTISCGGTCPHKTAEINSNKMNKSTNLSQLAKAGTIFPSAGLVWDLVWSNGRNYAWGGCRVRRRANTATGDANTRSEAKFDTIPWNPAFGISNISNKRATRTICSTPLRRNKNVWMPLSSLRKPHLPSIKHCSPPVNFWQNGR